MRKIVEQMMIAIRNKENSWHQGNTSVHVDMDNDILVCLHGKQIASISDDHIEISCGGIDATNIISSRLKPIVKEFTNYSIHRKGKFFVVTNGKKKYKLTKGDTMYLTRKDLK